MTTRRRVALGLVALALAAAAVVMAGEARTRLRVDTAVTAVAVGEPGCVTAARFTDPDGVERTVDVRVYKGNCLGKDPGDPITVYYDADDASVTAPSRAWWWPALLALPPAVVALVLVRVVARPPGPRRRRGRV